MGRLFRAGRAATRRFRRSRASSERTVHPARVLRLLKLRPHPTAPEIAAFVEAVYESWRAEGGEPDAALDLPRMLVDAGFRLVSARPSGFATRPHERNWRWPAEFVRTNVPRLVDLGVRDASWGNRVLAALAEGERDSASVFMTPTVLELITVKVR